MSYPKLEIYLNESSEICIAKVEDASSPSQLFVEIELDELKSQGIDGASHQLGFGIITSLRRWHAKEFESWDVPVAQESPELGDFSIAQCLIGKSVSSRTAVHVQSIDLLLSQEASKNEDAKRFFEENWPVIRARLASFRT
jgi:hypothetical protein